MNIIFRKVAVICASSLVAINFYSCNKNDVQTTQINEDGIETVKFFDVEKGDSIAKGIFREKPEFGDDVVVLATSEDLLKGEAISGGSGYIYDLKVSVRKKNNAPNMQDGYTKLDVDLNEGAGGKWIFLYYKKTNEPWNGMRDIKVKSQCCASFISADKYYKKLGISFSGGWTDLNEGAGGHFVQLQGFNINEYAEANKTVKTLPAYYGGNVITEVAIISSSNAMGSYKTGWTLEPTDLNKGAGGKYIYIAYKTIWMGLSK